MLILVGLLTIVELIFGGWFIKSNNLDYLFVMRDRVVEMDVNQLYPNGGKSVKVSWDKYGFRGGSEIFNHPENINILCVGGSTTMQLYVEDGKTWSEVLERKLSANGKNLHLANAGINGQSTFGHIKDFELWFTQVPNLKPKYILFYIGINDFFRFENPDHTSDNLKKEGWNALKGKIKDNSVLYHIVRTISGSIAANRYELSHSKVNFSKFEYDSLRQLKEEAYPGFFGERLQAYQQRLERLVSLSTQMGAIPIFITQPGRRYKFDTNNKAIGIQKVFKNDFGGYKINGTDFYYLLLEMNKEIQKVADKHGLLVIDQTQLNIWEDEDFYDFSHTTPKGSEKVGRHIASHLLPELNGK